MASVYTAVVLSDKSRSDLIAAYGLSPFYAEGWIIKAHHMTINTKDAEKSGVVDLLGQQFEMEVTHIGRLMVDDERGIVAVRVKTSAPSKNEVKHITIAHADGVKPMRSNDITEWVEFSHPNLIGTAMEVHPAESVKVSA